MLSTFHEIVGVAASPPGVVARTWIVWLPSSSALRRSGLAHGRPSPSTTHSVSALAGSVSNATMTLAPE